jgi:hypothetical protein
MSKAKEHFVRKDADGWIAIDQGTHHGFPVSYNPDDEHFYVHAPDSQDGLGCLGRFKSWGNAMYFAKQKAKARGDSLPQ